MHTKSKHINDDIVTKKKKRRFSRILFYNKTRLTL